MTDRTYHLTGYCCPLCGTAFAFGATGQKARSQTTLLSSSAPPAAARRAAQPPKNKPPSPNTADEKRKYSQSSETAETHPMTEPRIDPYLLFIQKIEPPLPASRRSL